METARPFNPHIKFFDLTLRGYIVLDVTEARVQADWFLLDDITDPDSAEESFHAAYSVADGATTLTEEDGPAEPIASAPALVP